MQRFPEWPFPENLDSFEKVNQHAEMMYIALVEDSLQRTEDLNTTDINTIGDITLSAGDLTLDAGDLAITVGNVTIGGTLTVVNLAVTSTPTLNTLVLDGGTYNITLDAGTPTLNLTYTFPVDGGTTGDVLYTTNGAGTLGWKTLSHNILHATHADTVAASAVAGDVLYANATPKWTKLAKGSDGEVLTLASGLPSWAAAGAGGTNIGLLATTASVDCSNGATTTIYTVPSGKSCIVTHVIVRNPSTDDQTVWFEVGFDVQAGVISIDENSWSSETMIPANTGEAIIVLAGGYGLMPAGTPLTKPYTVSTEIGDAADTLVFKCVNGQVSLTATVDVFGYTY